jgi:hypothetical protein
MGGVDGIEKGVNALIVVGVGVFMLLLFLALDYSSYAQTRNNLVTQYGSGAGVVANFTTNGGNITTTSVQHTAGSIRFDIHSDNCRSRVCAERFRLRKEAASWAEGDQVEGGYSPSLYFKSRQKSNPFKYLIIHTIPIRWEIKRQLRN